MDTIYKLQIVMDEAKILQTATKSYIQSKDRNIPLLMRYAKELSVEKTLRQYTEVLL